MNKKSQNFCNFAVKNGSEMLGRLVKSTAGRDCGRFFIVVGEIDEKYILLADGDLRRIESPKKKKLKHVKVYEAQAGQVSDRLCEGRGILNTELRKTISLLASQLDE